MLTLASEEFVDFLTKAQEISPWSLTCTQRGAWIKVIRSSPEGEVQDMPFCFVERSTGTIFRAANWRFPAKKFPRGNVFDEQNGMGQMTPDGPQHLKSGCPKGYKYDHPRKTPVRVKKEKPEGSDYIEPEPLIRIPEDTPFIPYPAPRKPLPVRVRHEADKNFFGAD